MCIFPHSPQIPLISELNDVENQALNNGKTRMQESATYGARASIQEAAVADG